MEDLNKPPNAGQYPLPYRSLVFNPLGLYDLRRQIGYPSVFTAFRQRFDRADIAWFTPGLASLPCNILGESEFHPDVLALHSNTPKGSAGTDVRNALRKRVKDLTFDSVRRITHSTLSTISYFCCFQHLGGYVGPLFWRDHPGDPC